MLGTPNLGSHEAVRWLVGLNPTEAKLSLLDLTHDVDGIIDIVRRFPGMVELLPFEDPGRYSQPALWKQLRAELGGGWPTVEEANAARGHRHLDAAARRRTRSEDDGLRRRLPEGDGHRLPGRRGRGT